MHGVLVIGYGNILRGDEAVGCHAAHSLEEHFRDDADVEVIAAQQLTPEMADDVAGCEFVLFLDVSSADAPGTIRQSFVLPEPCPRGFTNHLSPASLLAAAEQLYGDCPEGICLTIAGDCFEEGNRLSPIVRERLPRLVQQARHLVQSHRHAANGRSLARTR